MRSSPLRSFMPCCMQPAERRVQVPVVEQIVGHLVDQRVGVEIEAPAACRPTPSSGSRRSGRSRRRSRTIRGYPRLPTRRRIDPTGSRRHWGMPQRRRLAGLLAAGSSPRRRRRGVQRRGRPVGREGAQGVLPGGVQLRAGAQQGAHEGREERRPASSTCVEKMAAKAPKKIRPDVDDLRRPIRQVIANRRSPTTRASRRAVRGSSTRSTATRATAAASSIRTRARASDPGALPEGRASARGRGTRPCRRRRPC